MASIYANWRGSCTDRALQREMIGYVWQLAECSADRLCGPEVARPTFLHVMTAERKQNTTQVEPIRGFDRALSGNVVLDPCISMKPYQLLDEIQQLQLPTLEIERGGMQKEEAFVLSLSRSPAQLCLRLSSVRAYGIDFELFDPRRLYPEANRISFVFLNCPEIPALDGSLCQVENNGQCRAYNSATIRAADWFVATPNIHLRYLYEEWSDLVLGSVKYLFVPDLEYWRYDELPGYDALKDELDKLPRQQARQHCLEVLIERFEREADAGCGSVASLE